MDNPNNYATQLYLSDFLRKPLVRRIIDTLDLPPGSKGIDIGCGIGSHTLRLAEAVGRSGNVVGIDLSEHFINRAKKVAGQSGLSPPAAFRKGDMNAIPFEDNSFDWAWSMDCVGYAPGDKMDPIEEISRVVKPGGRVFILAWSSQQLLPGHPRLEARLNATSAGIAPFVHGQPPEYHFLKALGWFKKAAGLKDYTATTFVESVQAPLTDEQQAALISLFEMRWGSSKSELSEKDGLAFQRLCHPGSPDFILDLPDYYGFFTYTMFHGMVDG